MTWAQVADAVQAQLSSRQAAQAKWKRLVDPGRRITTGDMRRGGRRPDQSRPTRGRRSSGEAAGSVPRPRVGFRRARQAPPGRVPRRQTDDVRPPQCCAAGGAEGGPTDDGRRYLPARGARGRRGSLLDAWASALAGPDPDAALRRRLAPLADSLLDVVRRARPRSPSPAPSGRRWSPLGLDEPATLERTLVVLQRELAGHPPRAGAHRGARGGLRGRGPRRARP